MTNCVSLTGSLDAALLSATKLIGFIATENDGGAICGAGILSKDFADSTFSTPDDIDEIALGVGTGVPQCGSLRLQRQLTPWSCMLTYYIHRVWTDIFASRLSNGGGPAPLHMGLSGIQISHYYLHIAHKNRWLLH